LSWQADYVAELSGDETKLDLAGWVTLTNRSGTGYENAKLQLVAGDVNRVRQDFAPKGAMVAMAAPASREMAREEVFDYHLYSLGQPTSIRDNQTKQVALLAAAGVAVRKEYLLAGEAWYYQSQASDLGRKQKSPCSGVRQCRRRSQPLPAGVVRVYKGFSGNAIFIGEDAIDHTPKNDGARLKMGNADVTATRKQLATTAGRPAEPAQKPRCLERTTPGTAGDGEDRQIDAGRLGNRRASQPHKGERMPPSGRCGCRRQGRAGIRRPGVDLNHLTVRRKPVI
jgi:hypothetical protein